MIEDPTATLRELHAGIADADRAETPEQNLAALARLCNAASALDEWLTRGGALPVAWQRDPPAL